MANPTSNFGWQMPTPTDLVTDLPADFEVFGQAVDTSMADLKGGSTGQVLSKNSNTDMDFVWVTSDDANAIQNTIVDAKGDLIAASASDVPARLAVGANGETLVADSSTATGLKWASPATGPTFRAYRATTAQSFTPNVVTKVAFNAENWDSDNCFDSTTNYRFTPNKAGYYQLNCAVLIAASNGTEISLQVRKNGVNNDLLADEAMGPQTYATIDGSTLVYFNGSSDYVEMFVYAGAGSTQVYEGAVNSFFTGVWIRS